MKIGDKVKVVGIMFTGKTGVIRKFDTESRWSIIVELITTEEVISFRYDELEVIE